MNARRSVSLVLSWLCAVAGGLLLWSAPVSAQRMHEFSKSFGNEGSGEGQLLRPGQVAVNESTGDVYVVDRGNSRVEIFNSSGAFVGQFNGAGTPSGVFFWPIARERENAEDAIAVDNSSNPLDPSKGDVYVLDFTNPPSHNPIIDKFSASGAYIGQITGPKVTEMDVSGLAVDTNGALWANVENGLEGHQVVEEFNDASPVNEYASSLPIEIPNVEGQLSVGQGHVGLALDAEGNLYTGFLPKAAQGASLGGITYPIEFSKSGGPLVEHLDEEETTGLAVDELSGDVYVDHEAGVAAYGPSHDLIERFGSGELQASQGIAVDSATGVVYAANAASQQIDVFDSFVVPDVSTEPASSLGETSVTVNGVANADGLPVTSCVFEYGTSTGYGQSAPCSAVPAGDSPVAVSAHLTGLNPLTEYHYRLSVANANGSDEGRDLTFLTPEPVAFSEEAVADVSATSARVGVQLDPGAADASYQVEYGTSVSYGSSVPVPAGDAGSQTTAAPVSVRLEGLLPDTVYHARFVASNLLGVVYGPDQSFTTQVAGGEFALPDGRQWEEVSPSDKQGALILAIDENAPGPGTNGLIQAAAGGDALVYAAAGPAGASVSGNPTPFGVTQLYARRGANGWSTEDVTPPADAAGEGIEPNYTFFSPDLSKAIVMPPLHTLLSPEATEAAPYAHDMSTGTFVPLVSASNVPPGVRFGPEFNSTEALGVTPDFSHVAIASRFRLTENAIEGSGENLYEWSGGRLQLVNELPDHTVPPGARLGGGSYDVSKRNAMSSDGSRIFFTIGDKGNEIGPLYMRDTVTGRTVQIDAPAPGVATPPDSRAEFQIASEDGSKVFFLDGQPLTVDSKLKPVELSTGSRESGDLYVFEAGSGELKDLSVDPNPGEDAEVQDEVLGASEDGSVVYFVAKGRLAAGAQAGRENLYVVSQSGSSWSAPRLVAVLSEEDNNDWDLELNAATSGSHNLGVGLQLMTSRVSANGRYLVFMSDQSLTGYDNHDAVSGKPDEEVFLYDEATEALRCISCNPTGARPDGVYDVQGVNTYEKLLVDPKSIWFRRWLAASIPGWTLAREGVFGVGESYASRVLSDEGRVFFDSADALVPQATNGKEDVYEYEPQGVGSCGLAAGCVSLVSAGTSVEESAFLDASENGDDVFFMTAARLVAGDVDSSFDVYDAHACSVVSPCASVPVAAPACSSGDSCKPSPSPQPAVFGAPSSATFSGAGNVSEAPAPAAVVVAGGKAHRGKPAGCRSGYVKRRGKCVKRSKAKKKTSSGRGSRVGGSRRGGGR